MYMDLEMLTWNLILVSWALSCNLVSVCIFILYS